MMLSNFISRRRTSDNKVIKQEQKAISSVTRIIINELALASEEKNEIKDFPQVQPVSSPFDEQKSAYAIHRMSLEELDVADTSEEAMKYELKSRLENEFKPRTLYLAASERGLAYELIGLDGQYKRALIPWKKLPGFPRNDFDIVNSKNQLLKPLLEYTAKLGHTLPQNLMDPVNSRLMIIPLKPSKNSPLPAIELSSLYQWVNLKGITFHPCNPELLLDLKCLGQYVLDEQYLGVRDNYLRENGYTLDDFLHYRGLNRAEYQNIIKTIQGPNWIFPALGFAYLLGLALGGIKCFESGPGLMNLFFSPMAEENQDLSTIYGYLHYAASFISVGNTVAAHWAWGRSRVSDSICSAPIVYTTAIFSLISLALMYLESTLLSNYEQAHDLSYHNDQAAAILPKLFLPFFQSYLVAIGYELHGITFFSRNRNLIDHYVELSSSKPRMTERSPELESPPVADLRHSCGLM